MHGAEVSYLPASHAQELLVRVLAGTDQIMKYMKAQCSGLTGYISVLPGPSRSLNFARSTSVPQKKHNPAAFPILYEPSGLHEDQKICIKGENHFRYLPFFP